MIVETAAEHHWTPPEAAEAAAILNRTVDEDGDMVFPHVEITSIPGLNDLAESGSAAHKRVGEHGEVSRRNFRGGKTYTYTGIIRATTQRELEVYMAELRAAFADQSSEGRMDHIPRTASGLYTVADDRFFNAQPRGLELAPLPQNGGLWRASFVLALRNSAGVYYDEIVTRTNLATNPKLGVSTSGWTDADFDTFARSTSPGGTSPPQATALSIGNGSNVPDGDMAYLTVPVVSGHTYHFSCYVRLTAQDGSPGEMPTARLEIRNAAGTLKANDTDAGLGVPGSTWYRLDAGVTADSTGDWRFGIAQYNGGGANGRISAMVTGALVEEAGALDDYFDGDSASSRWTGTEELSTSEFLEIDNTYY